MEKDITKICAICNHTFIGKSSYKINKHILQEHGLNLEQYILKTLYNDIRPTCKCGCGENLIKNSYTPNFELNYDDVIMTKEYLKTIISKNGIKYINRIRKLTLKFLKVFGYMKNGENIKIIKNINYILGLDDGIVKDLTLSNIFN